jgi:hypothetical protein
MLRPYYPLEKAPVRIVHEAELTPGKVWGGEKKNSTPQGLETWTVEPVASGYIE